MKLLQAFTTNHQDLIHDIAYDYCGKRLATCSSDQTVKIFDLVDGEWKLSTSWKVFFLFIDIDIDIVYHWLIYYFSCLKYKNIFKRLMLVRFVKYLGLIRNSVSCWRRVRLIEPLSYGKKKKVLLFVFCILREKLISY